MLYPVQPDRLIILEPPARDPSRRRPLAAPLLRRHVARLQAANAALEARLAELTAQRDQLQADLAQACLARSQCNARLAELTRTINELQRTNTELNAAWHADRQRILEQCQ